MNDSKQLTEAARQRLAAAIRDRARAWAIGWASVEEIDRLNIRQANFLAMKRAFDGLAPRPGLALVDGKDPPQLACDVSCIIGGDRLEPAISAASILAKTSRDAAMIELDGEHPAYGFARHKGYGVAAHLAVLRTLGPCPAHRMSFRPVREAAAAFM